MKISTMMTRKHVNALLRGVLAAMPAIPYLMRRPSKMSTTAYIAGGIGFALAGGLAALFLFSPKTRTRALTAAKHGYNKVSGTIAHLKPVLPEGKDTDAMPAPTANGFAGHSPSAGL